jgi:hypothetical protein
MAGPPADDLDDPPRPRLSREALRRAPHLGWSALIDVVTTTSDWQRLAPARRVAWLGYHYDADVTIGGHRRFLERADAARRTATREALAELGADALRGLLERSLALDGAALDALDRDYHACSPDLSELLEQWLAERLPEFVLLE